MQRLTAKFLLVFALAGFLLPPALQATATPLHICCRRAGEHRCHTIALTDPNQSAVRAPGCRNDCRQAVASSQWAHPEPAQIALASKNISGAHCDAHALTVAIEFSSSSSSRAPPLPTLA